MFQLNQQEVVLSHAMIRIEKKGKKQRAPASSLTIVVTGGNDLLDLFEPGLSKTFFRKAAKGKAPMLGEQQGLIEGADGLVQIKHPMIASLPIKFEKEGYEFQIEPLNEGEDPIFFTEVKVFECEANMFEGGSVSVKAKLSFPTETDDANDIHRAWLREKVIFTLTPPSKQTGGQTIDDGTDPDTDPENPNP